MCWGFFLNLIGTHFFKWWLHVLINRILKQRHMKENFSDKSEQNNRTILKFGLKINFEELFLCFLLSTSDKNVLFLSFSDPFVALILYSSNKKSKNEQVCNN